jgi:2-aminoadipate transaminase
VLINKDDEIIIEEPGYLGAIQALSLYQPKYNSIPLNENGIDCDRLKQVFSNCNPKLFYAVPNFQNPSGITYTDETRRTVARMVSQKRMYIIEDDPYGELRYSGTNKRSFANLIPEQTILLGSFSKTVVPGFRLGWAVLPDNLYDKVLVAKQASDSHTNIFAQGVLHQFLTDNELSDHVKIIRKAYGIQCEAMIKALELYFPSDIEFTRPEGGMFLWVKLPGNKSAMKLFEKAIMKNVAFVPGDPFYINKSNVNTLRLNFSCTLPETINEGIKRLANVFSE